MTLISVVDILVPFCRPLEQFTMKRTLAIAAIVLLAAVSAAPICAGGSDDGARPPVKHHATARKRHRARTGAAEPVPTRSPDRASSERTVCRSQCELQRMSCDQGRAGAYQNRTDQLQAAQASCGLAVQSCLSRC